MYCIFQYIALSKYHFFITLTSTMSSARERRRKSYTHILSTFELVKRASSVSIFHMKTLWLFTCSDNKTILLPATVFGVSNAMASPMYGLPIENNPSYTELGWRSSLVMFWVWINLLLFCVSNQRSILSIMEDRINKPWRPLPSSRLSPYQAKIILILLYILAPTFSAISGYGLRQTFGLVLLGIYHNNMGGGDSHPLIRNLLNAAGYTCFLTGAMEAALGRTLPLSSNRQLMAWFGAIIGVVTTTMHAQDMYDQEGDAARGRRTMPLVIGDVPARWAIAIFVLLWGILCPKFWGVDLTVQVSVLAVSLLVGFRMLLFRSVPSDRKTFVVWNVWITMLYTLPLCKLLEM
ncbi:UbiA prenyltransferase family-domain-containing protein [Jackrogersella minutella]|nr:UbiA prenyltransferase family-domain-containing protein [Jackrogersella minutella]